MQKNRKQRLFYKNGQLSSAIGSTQPVTLFVAANTPLAERSAETLLTAVNSQNSITNSSHRDRTQSLTYSAYGHSHIDRILGYTGQRYDRFTNLYILGNGYRAYSSHLMRFFSPDTLSPFGNGGRNAYAYCGGDPTNHIDPSGHMYKKPLSFFGIKRDTSPFVPNQSKYYSKAVSITERIPELAEFPKWFDSPHTQKKHLKQAVKLAIAKDKLDNWTPSSDNDPFKPDEIAILHLQNQYYEERQNAIEMIKKIYIATQPKQEISPLPSVADITSKVRKPSQASSPDSNGGQRP